MSGREFWTWFPVWFGAACVAWRFTVAAWRDHDDDLDRYAIGSHLWPIEDDE